MLRQICNLGYVALSCALLVILACLAFSLQAAEPSAPPSQNAPPLSAKPWHSPLKDIKAGPGRLDFGFNLRARYEYLDNFNILYYGTGAADDVLLLRTRLSADYGFTDQAHAFIEFQDARYWLSDLALSDLGRSSSYCAQFDLRLAVTVPAEPELEKGIRWTHENATARRGISARPSRNRMNTTLLIALFVVFVTSGVFSMFGKGGGSLYTPVLVVLGMVVSTPAAAVPGRADLLYKSALLVSSPVALRRLERTDATTLFRLARCKPVTS